MGDSVMNDINGVLITPLKIIDTLGGDVMHAMKKGDDGYSSFGEAYFSTIEPGVIKGWKRHHKMTLNLVVPVGAVRFIVFDNRLESNSFDLFQQVVLSTENYCRLTIPSMLWVGFQGVDDVTSMLLNIADTEYHPDELDRMDLKDIDFDWSK